MTTPGASRLDVHGSTFGRATFLDCFLLLFLVIAGPSSGNAVTGGNGSTGSRGVTSVN